MPDIATAGSRPAFAGRAKSLVDEGGNYVMMNLFARLSGAIAPGIAPGLPIQRFDSRTFFCCNPMCRHFFSEHYNDKRYGSL